MKKSTYLQIFCLSVVLSSCGFFDRWKTPEQPSDTVTSESGSSVESTASSSSENASSDIDDLFGKSMEESATANNTGTDAPGNVDTTARELEEFSADSPGQTMKETGDKPVIVQETIPEIKEEAAPIVSSDAGTIQNYKVQRGETLMQIAFKLYGDIGKWKELKEMNRDQLTKNSALRADMTLKYRAPETPFVWNPVGVPYLIKNGDTLGIISNNVYATPKKWKTIWENNKPLIKNPNVIFAGFTLYYKKNPGMANYVQPASAQPKSKTATEEVMVDEMLDNTTTSAPTAAPASAPTTSPAAEITNVNVDEAQTIQSAPARAEISEGEIDLVNNVSAPLRDEAIQGINANDLPPVIDEEIQTLE